MVIVIVRHVLKSDRVAQAERQMNGNGERMRARPGFLFRYHIVADGNSLDRTSLTGWRTRDDMLNWNKFREANSPPPETPDSPFEVLTSTITEVSHLFEPGGTKVGAEL